MPHAPCPTQHEHALLLRCLGRAQTRCSDTLLAQHLEIQRLQGVCMRLRAQLVLRDTAASWWGAASQPRLADFSFRLHRYAAFRLGRFLAKACQAALPAAAATGRRAIDAAVGRTVDAACAAADHCEKSCVAQGFVWRVDGACQQHGGACVLDAESVASGAFSPRPPAPPVRHVAMDSPQSTPGA